jgi:phosphoribosylamine--glycine ligase
MRVLVVGGGAREHTIVWRLVQDPRVSEVLVAPGNAGTAIIARNLDLPAKDVQPIVDAALTRAVDLIVVGPEDPLAAGIVDVAQRAGVPAFGPTRAAAQIESSKWFAKQLMARANIPTAAAERFTSLHEARAFLNFQPPPYVIKADGLAAGKGVAVATTKEEAFAILDRMMTQRVYGEAGETVVVEELLEGPEVSLMAFVDGETVVPMVPACDYKRAGDGDTGPNTGGMGCYSPPGFFGPDEVAWATEAILRPAVRALAAGGAPFRGVLYAGLMQTAEGPKVLEFNCRFGDPEAAVVLPRLKTPLLDVLRAVVDGRLADQPVEWDPEPCLAVVIASEGYPEQPQTGVRIEGLDRAEPGTWIFHAGTRLAPRPERRSLMTRRLGEGSPLGTNEVRTSGGRVLTVVAKAPSIGQARRSVYATVGRIRIDGALYRRDIGEREVTPGDAETPSEQAPACKPISVATDPGPEAHARLAELRQALAAGEPGLALQRLRDLLDEFPNWPTPARTLADASVRLGRYDEAASAWARVVRLDPEDAIARHNLAAVQVRQGNFELAEIEMREAARLDPDYVDARSGLATLLSRRGDFAGALIEIEAALKVEPRSAALRLDHAMILERAGRRESAAEAARYAANLAPDEATRGEAEALAKRLSGRRWFG